MKYEVTVGENKYNIEVNQEGAVMLDGQEVQVDFSEIGTGLCLLIVNNESFEGLVEQKEDGWGVLFRGDLYDVQVADERTQLMRARSGMAVPDSGELPIKAPMPGLVVRVLVQPGQGVEPGQGLIVLEAMKMENELKARAAARIRAIRVAPGQAVEKGQLLVEFEP